LDRELVNQVTEQVILLLRRQGVAIPPAAAGQPIVSPSPEPGMTASETKPARTSAAPPAGKIFVTAEMLRQRLASSGGGGIELACNEFLTPNAVDLAEQRQLAIRRSVCSVSPAQAAPIGAETGAAAPVRQAAAPGACGTIGLVVHRADEKVRNVLAGLTHDGVVVVDFTQGDCWMADVRRLCQAVVAGQVASGAAILPYGADAMVLASKIKGIRPVQGTRPESVAAALRHFGANLLVLEHAFSTYHQMRAMIRILAAGGPGAYAALLAALAELERS
jgi:ribose 5-phosphate isomerase RpiB